MLRLTLYERDVSNAHGSGTSAPSGAAAPIDVDESSDSD